MSFPHVWDDEITNDAMHCINCNTEWLQGTEPTGCKTPSREAKLAHAAQQALLYIAHGWRHLDEVEMIALLREALG